MNVVLNQTVMENVNTLSDLEVAPNKTNGVRKRQNIRSDLDVAQNQTVMVNVTTLGQTWTWRKIRLMENVKTLDHT